MARRERYTEIRYTRRTNEERLTLDLWSSSSPGGGLIITELGPAVSRSPALSLLLKGGLKSPEPASVFFCVRVFRGLRAVISDKTSREVERTR
jgi:hypothetical protein